MPRPHQLLQVILQNPTLLDGMPFIPMISAIQILISSWWVTPHLARPSKVRLVFNSSRILCTGSLNITFTSPTRALGFWILRSLLGLGWKPPYWESFEYWAVTSAFPLFYCWSSANLLYSSIRLISSKGLLVSYSINSESSGNPNQKLLVAIFSLPLLISLYSS